MLVGGLVILFLVMCGGSAVRVRGEFVELGSSLVRVMGHSDSYSRLSLYLGGFPFFRLFNKEHPRGLQKDETAKNPDWRHCFLNFSSRVTIPKPL